jgi:VanZ family protein
MAWSLAGLFAALIVYASLYPFTGWRWPAVMWWAFVFAPWPRYWTVLDLMTNALGYIPLGFFLGVVAARQAPNTPRHWWTALVAPMMLSFVLESLQTALPSRVPSNVDWALNSLGAWWGVGLAWVLRRWGLLMQWSRLRRTLWTADAYGALVLLGLWPVALLYPTSMPFALGHISPELLDWAQTAWRDAPPWLQTELSEPASWPILPWSLSTQVSVVGLGIFTPVVLGYQVLRQASFRKWWLLAVVLGAVVIESISSGLTYGPNHFAAWWTQAMLWGMLLAVGLGMMVLALDHRLLVWVLLLTVLTMLLLLNLSTQPPYLHESLEVWTQGRFIHFYGATQWLGWCWPYAVLWYAFKHVQLPIQKWQH